MGCANNIHCTTREADTAQGFDEFMNLVLDDAFEVTLKTKDTPESRRKVGRFLSRPMFACMNTFNMATGQILLKGDNISLIQQI